MKCPHCDHNISIFSKALNSFKKSKYCHNCNRGINFYLKLPIILMLLPIIFLLYYFLLPQLKAYGVSSSVFTVLMCGISILLAMNLKKAQLHYVILICNECLTKIKGTVTFLSLKFQQIKILMVKSSKRATKQLRQG